MGAVSELFYVGNLYYGSIFRERKFIADDHFLVVDEYERQLIEGFDSYARVYCLLMSIRTGVMHEVEAFSLKLPRYKRVA